MNSEIYTRLFAFPAASRKDELMQTLRDNGYGSLVTENVNANTLASFVREQKAMNNDEIPGWLSGVISACKRVSVGVRRG